MGGCCGTPVKHTVHLPPELETGDLILFRTNSLAASVTRWCTDAPFDHVAMILRTSEGLRTVECTGQGIGCWVLQERIDDHIIKGVVIRRLRTNLTNEMVEKLNEFLQSVKHKPYRLNPTLVQRMIRTCLCCQRVGQNDHGLETDRVEAEKRRKREAERVGKGGAAAKYLPAGGPAEETEEMKENMREEDEMIEEGQVPLPSHLLPPMPHDNNHHAHDQLAALEAAGLAPLTPRSLGAKRLLELKEHEAIKKHYPEPEDIANVHTKSGYFCSSFIAACYMRMGLLPSYPPIDWYLPNTFSSRTAIQPPLINAEFGEESLVAKPSQDMRKTKWSYPYKEKEREKQEVERKEKEQFEQKMQQYLADLEYIAKQDPVHAASEVAARERATTSVAAAKAAAASSKAVVVHVEKVPSEGGEDSIADTTIDSTSLLPHLTAAASSTKDTYLSSSASPPAAVFSASPSPLPNIPTSPSRQMPADEIEVGSNKGPAATKTEHSPQTPLPESLPRSKDSVLLPPLFAATAADLDSASTSISSDLTADSSHSNVALDEPPLAMRERPARSSVTKLPPIQRIPIQPDSEERKEV